MVLNKASRIVDDLSDIIFWFFYLKQSLIGIYISDFEVDEFNPIDIIFWFTEELGGRRSQRGYILNSDWFSHCFYLFQLFLNYKV